MNLSQKTSSSSDDEANKYRLYEILTTRLGRFLKHHPDFNEEEDDDDDEIPWCHCKQGMLGGDSIRCDVPDCRILWYHKACLPYQDLKLADDFDLWICPNCLVHQLLDLIREQNPARADSQFKADMDPSTRRQINMALIDIRLHERGQWIFKDPLKSAARRWKRELDAKAESGNQSAHLRPDTPTSIATTGNLYPGSVASGTSSRDESPKRDTWGASVSVVQNLSMSVANACSLQETARIWTSQATQVLETSENTLIVEYKHDCAIPRLQDRINNSRRVLLKCTTPRGGNNTIEVSLHLILDFCLNLHFVFWKLRDLSAPQGLLGTIRLKYIELRVLKKALKFLQGGSLSIRLPDNDTPLSKAQKSTLLQYTHLAHMLSIQPLQNAAMHALCTSILRRPQDWSDRWEIASLLKETTFKTNPAHRVLIDRSNCLLPYKDRQDLPCGVEQRDIICMNRGVKALWKKGGRMYFEYAEHVEVLEGDCVDSGYCANDEDTHGSGYVDMDRYNDEGGCLMEDYVDDDKTMASDDENDRNFEDANSDNDDEYGNELEDEYFDL